MKTVWIAALTAGLAVTGCASGSSPAPAQTPTAPPASQRPSSPSTSVRQVRVTVPSKPCSVLTRSQISKATSGKTVTTKASPPNGCLYLGNDGKVAFVYRLSSKEQLPAGIESLRQGAQASMGGPASAVTVRGFDGFQVSGTGAGIQEVEMAVQVGSYVLEVTVTQGDDADTQRAIARNVTAAILTKVVSGS